MSHRAALTLTLALALVSVACAIPLDEMSSRNDISGASLPENAREWRGAAFGLGQLVALEGNEPSRIDGTRPEESRPAFIELNSDKVREGSASSGNDSRLVD